MSYYENTTEFTNQRKTEDVKFRATDINRSKKERMFTL